MIDSTKDFQKIIQNTSAIILTIDLEGEITFANNTALDFFGYSYEELLGKHMVCTILPEQESTGRDLVKMAENLTNDPESFHNNINENMRKNGEHVWIEWTNSGIYDDSGQLKEFMSVGIDITGHMKTKQALKESENKYGTLLNSMSEMFQVLELIYDKNGQAVDYYYHDINPASERLMNMTRDQIIGKRAKELFDVVEDYWIHVLDQVNKTTKSMHINNYSKALNKHYDVYAFKVDGQNKVAVIFTDITEFKKNKEAIEISEKKYRTLFDSIDEGYCIIDVIFDEYENPVDYRYLEVNSAFEKQTGLHNAEGQLMRTIRPDHEDHWFEIYGEIALTGKPKRFENPAKALNRFYDVYAFKIGDPESRKVAVLFSDISDVKKTEAALKELNENLELKVHERTAELNVERQRFFDVFEIIPIMICILTEDYHVVFANKSFRDKFGESKGRYCYEYCFGKSEPCEFCEAFQVLETGKPHYWELNAPDGSIIERYNYLLKDFDGSNLVLEMDVDITEQRQAQEALKDINENLEVIVEERTKSLQDSQNQFEALIQNLKSGVALINEDGEFKVVNNSFLKMFDLEDDTDIYNINSLDWRQWKVYGENHELLPFKEHPVRKVAITYKPIINKLISVQNPGENNLTWMMVSAVPIFRETGKPNIICTYYDVTERVKTEKLTRKLLKNEQQLREELQTSNKELQATNEELQNISTILQATVTELETSNKELEQFAYVASHDLQEPLRMVSSFTQLLEKKYKGQLDKDADDYIGYIVEGSHRMKNLIDDLLIFSRLNTEAKEFKLTDLNQTLDNVLINFKNQIEDDEVKITHNSMPIIKCDESQFNQLFQNLISNAIKFHNDNLPEIHISSQESGNDWLFSVKDNGIGIDPEHHEKIFEVFKRLHTRDEYIGTGIGLAICRRIVERHGGKIWVESEPDNGANFYFTIPK